MLYNLTYSNMIQHFIDYKIYDYDKDYMGGFTNESEIIIKIQKRLSLLMILEIKKKLLPLILFIGRFSSKVI